MSTQQARRLGVMWLIGLTMIAGMAYLPKAALAAPQAPITEPATSVSATSATLNGELNPTSTATVGWHFAYSTGASCTGAFTTPAEPEAEVHAQKVHAEVNGLEPNRAYAFCLVATNATEETVGGALSFTTLAIKPSVDFENASAVTPTDAILEGLVNPNNEETSYHFLYATNQALTGATTVPGSVLPASYGDQPVSADIGGTLAPDTTYYYRMVAENAAGIAEGIVQSFTTTAPPILTIGQAQSITRTSAMLTGTVNPAGLETTYYYQYGTSTSYGDNAPSIQGVSAGSGFSPLPAPIGIGGLVPASTYHYRLVATNADGTSYSPDATFTTAPAMPPSATTGQASNITLTTATVSGTIDPAGLPTSYELDLGSSTAYGTSLYGEAATGGTESVTVSIGLHDLAPGVIYHYRIDAINSDGRVYGHDQTFSTPAYSKPITLGLPRPLLATAPTTLAAEAGSAGRPTAKKKARKHRPHKRAKKHKTRRRRKK